MRSNSIKTLFISGISGSGKDYICNKLLEYDNSNDDIQFNLCKQITTRKKRKEEELREKHGLYVNYDFVTKEEFQKNHNLFAITEFNNNWYGTKLSELKVDNYINLVIVDPNGYNNAITTFNNFNEVYKLKEYRKFQSNLLLVLSGTPFEKREDRDDEFVKKEQDRQDILLYKFAKLIYTNSPQNSEESIKHLIQMIKFSF